MNNDKWQHCNQAEALISGWTKFMLVYITDLPAALCKKGLENIHLFSMTSNIRTNLRLPIWLAESQPPYECNSDQELNLAYLNYIEKVTYFFEDRETTRLK